MAHGLVLRISGRLMAGAVSVLVGCTLAGPAAAQFAASLVLEAGDDRLVIPPLSVDAAVAGLAGGGPVVDIRLTPETGLQLEAVTSAHIGDPISVQLCGVELMRPTVQAAIADAALRLPAPTLAAAERMAAILAGEAPCAALND